MSEPTMSDANRDPASPLNTSAFRDSSAFERVRHSLGSVVGPLIGLVLVLAIFGIWRPDSFFTTGALQNVLRNNYHFAIAAVGMTFVIITAGIDLSVSSTMALACVVCAYLLRGFTLPTFDARQAIAMGGLAGLTCGLCAAGRRLRDGHPRARSFAIAALWAIGVAVVTLGLWAVIAGRQLSPMPLPVALLGGITVGALVGFLNGTLIANLALPPFIITLATLEGVRGIALYIAGGTPVDLVPSPSLRALHYGSLLNLPPNVWITLLIVLLVAPILHFTVLGRYAFAIGSNERTARLCGVPVERYKILCYVISGATAGLAGVLMTSQLRGGPPNEFRGDELTVIAAVVIGGTSLFGGEGTVIGSVLGVLMLGFLRTGCNIADISSYVQPVFVGGTIVLAAAADRFRNLGR